MLPLAVTGRPETLIVSDSVQLDSALSAWRKFYHVDHDMKLGLTRRPRAFVDVRMNEPSPPVEGAFNYSNPYPFTTATRKKKRRNKLANVVAPTSHELVDRTRIELQSDSAWVEKTTASIFDAVRSLPDDDEGLDVICLGLGSPVASLQARFQLCFLLELLKNDIVPIQSKEAFDPVFSEEDKSLLESFGVQVSSYDQSVLLGREIQKHTDTFLNFFCDRAASDSDLAPQKGAYILKRRTIAYMPHCEFRIYENLLRANWSSKLLARLVVVGNIFEDYSDSPKFDLKTEAPCMHRLVPLMNSVPFEPHATHRVAFSGTAVQSVSVQALPSEPVFVYGAEVTKEEDDDEGVDASSSFQSVEFWNPAPPLLKTDHDS